MADNKPLLGEEEPFATKAKKGCLKCLVCTSVTCFLGVWVVQGCAYWYGLNFSCSASDLEGYTYPGAEASDEHSAEENLVPRIVLLGERPFSPYGDSFDVIPSNEASSVSKAPIGVWWQTWGPLFTTYTYQDTHTSNTVLYMRRNMLRLGMSHRIGRCDGKGEQVVFNEGTNWFSNRARYVFGLNQAYTFKLYVGDEQVGEIQEQNKGTPSLTVSGMDGTQYGSSVLQERHFHGNRDLWLVKTTEDAKIPYWVTQAITALFAFYLPKDAHQEKHYKAPSLDTEHTLLLAAATNTTDPMPVSTHEAKATPTAEQATELEQI